MAARTNNQPSNIAFGYSLDGTPKNQIPEYIKGVWKEDRGAGDPCFSSPFLVTAAAYGPQEWFDNGWEYAKTHTKTINFYGEYINILSMITASGNNWNPLF